MKKNILIVAFFFHIFILNGYAHIYEIYGPEYTCDGNSTWNEAVMCMSITLNSNNTVSATISKPNGGDFKDDHKPAMYLQRDDNGRYATNLTSSMLYIQSSITLVSDNLDSYIFPDDNILVLYGRMDNEAGDFAWVGPLKIKRASYCPFPAPKLNVPSNGNINISTTKQEFSWFGVNGNAGTPEYRIVVSTDRSFDYFIDGPLDNQGSAYCEHDTLCKTAKISNTFYSGFNLEYATTYYWKVRAGNQNASGVWSEIRSFTTEKRIEYEWKIGSWGSCNASCGSGMKYREIFCIRNDTMQTVSDINCKEFTKPNDAEICTDYSPYLWKTDSWSDCSASCGSGIRTRDVYCIRCDGVKVSDLNCSYSKPVDKESCSGTDCPVCDRDHLYLCNQNSCNDASGYWYNNVCNQYPEPETCDLTHLELCDLNNCSEVGGYWYNSKCNKYPEPDKCDNDHLFLCDSCSNCENAGGYWYNSQCNIDPEALQCDGDHLHLCFESSDCIFSGGFWYNTQCNTMPEPAKCDYNHVHLCNNITECHNAGGFWYENTCNKSTQKSIYHEFFEEAGNYYNLPFNLLKAIAYVESGWNQSFFIANAFGIMGLKEDDLILIAQHLKKDFSHDYGDMTIDDIITRLKEDSNDGAKANIRGAAFKLKYDADENSELIYENEPRHALEVWWFVVASYNGGGGDNSIHTSNYPFRVYNCFINGVQTENDEELVPQIPITLPPNITFRLPNNDEILNGEVKNTDHELVPCTPPGFIRNTIGFDACIDIGYLHDNDGQMINQPNCQPDHFFLHFPLKGFTSSDAPINSVFDYSQPGIDTLNYYKDNFVVDYMGEYGHRQNGAFKDGFKNKDGTIFHVNGNYKAAGFGSEYLFYDGHPGIDYKAGYGEKLYATADGYFYINKEPDGNSGTTSSAYIDHGNYRTYYVHCQKFTPENKEYVIADEEIGESGNEGSTGPHLHLEIQKRIANKWYVVDPYGWQADKDKNWTEAANTNLWAGGHGGTILKKPQNFTVEVMDNSNVKLSWQPPSGGEPDKYNVYRDNTKIASINGDAISYIDTEIIPDGIYKYYIRSLFNGIESSTSNPGRIVLSEQEEMVTKKIELKQGWNWISFSIQSDEDNTLNSILSSINDYAIKIVSQNGYAEYYNGWYGPLKQIDPAKMYMLKVSQNCDLILEGYPLNPKNINYSLNENWNWVGFINDSMLNIQTALSLLSDKGIKIVGQEGYAEYESGWWGSLSNLKPNAGYMLKMSVPFSFNWDVHQSRKRLNKRRSRGGSINLPKDWIFSPSNFRYFETITATVHLNGSELDNSNYVLAAFINDQFSGVSKAVKTKFGNRFFVQVWNNDLDGIIEFKLFDSSDRLFYHLNSIIEFKMNHSVGSIVNPILLE